MRRFLTLVCLICLAIPAGISFSGCSRNPAANYCLGTGYGRKITDVASITLTPQTTGISLAFGQTRQVATPTAKTCKGDTASVTSYTYGTTDAERKYADISPSGNICAGTWNRNTGGGIADYTTCIKPDPLPTTNSLPYKVAYVTASANSVTSNPVEVYVHAQVSSVTLALSSAVTQRCYSQGEETQLDAQACYSSNSKQVLLCAPSTVSSANYACPLPAGVTSVPDCTAAIGAMTYAVGTSSVAEINSETNQITAEQPGTTVITTLVATSGASSAGYFSTCPPKSIAVKLNGSNIGTVTKGVTQNLTTTVTDTRDQTITGLSLDYQSTNPLDISVASGGAVTASYPGEASVFAVCQPSTCNPSPINQVGLYGTGLPISSNSVTITTPGTASAYVWFAAPGKSQYFIPVELLSGTVGSTVRLPYVPNSMVMDKTGTSLYFGSSRELMIYTTSSNSLSKEDSNVPGVVLAVAPDNSSVLINDQTRKVFYIYNPSGTITAQFGGVGNAATWTPDSKTLYISDSASLGSGHSDTLYVYNSNTGWTTSDLSASGGAQNLALTIPGVGAYLSGSPTVSHTWCPTGTAGDYSSMKFYPEADSVAVQTDVLAATTDGQHILGAVMSGGGLTLSDIGVTIPATECTLSSALSTNAKLLTQSPLSVNVNATAVNQIVPSPASDLAFITYTASSSNTNASLPYYKPVTSGAGTVNYVTLTGSSAITAPLVGAFSPDDKIFFVSTAGDNLIHYIDVSTLKDTQQIAPSLPACSSGTDSGCTTPGTGVVPATAIAVKPRSTT
jgi:sugar lactone lactonase YvrE